MTCGEGNDNNSSGNHWDKSHQPELVQPLTLQNAMRLHFRQRASRASRSASFPPLFSSTTSPRTRRSNSFPPLFPTTTSTTITSSSSNHALTSDHVAFTTDLVSPVPSVASPSSTTRERIVALIDLALDLGTSTELDDDLGDDL